MNDKTQSTAPKLNRAKRRKDMAAFRVARRAAGIESLHGRLTKAQKALIALKLSKH